MCEGCQGNNSNGPGPEGGKLHKYRVPTRIGPTVYQKEQTLIELTEQVHKLKFERYITTDFAFEERAA